MMTKQTTNANAAISPLPRALSPEEASKVGGGYMITPGGNLVYTDPNLSAPIVIKVPHPTLT
jgi:hypothetical protein